MILYSKLHGKTVEEIIELLEPAGRLSFDELYNIHLSFENLGQEFRKKSNVLVALLDNATLLNQYDLLTEGEKKSRVFDVFLDELYLVKTLNAVSIAMYTLYKDSTPHMIHKIVLEWESFFFTAAQMLYDENQYKLTANIYYPTVLEWLEGLRDRYSLHNLSLRNSLLTTASTDPITDDVVSSVATTGQDVREQNTQTAKTFASYLLHDKPDALAIGLVSKFNGKKLEYRVMIEVLKSWDPPLISVIQGEMAQLYKSMVNAFGPKIGHYSTFNDVKPDPKRYPEEYESARIKITHILVELQRSV